MALSNADLHWIPMNRNKFDQLRSMFDSKATTRVPSVRSCDKCASPRIRYSSADNSSALAQIRALLRPVDGSSDSSSNSSRSRNVSEDSADLRNNNRSNLLLIDPLLCSKSNSVTLIRNDNVILDDNRKYPVCETVAEVTENLAVGGPTPRAAKTNSCSEKCDPIEVDSAPLLNGDTVLRNGNHVEVNGDVKIRVTSEMGEVRHVAKLLDTNDNDTLDNDKENMSHLENGSSDTGSSSPVSTDHVICNGSVDSESSLDEEVAGDNVFLRMVNAESLVLSAEREYFVCKIDSVSDISEEAGGRVMAACGKANLLLTSKFKQYRGLCAEYERTSRKMTTDDMQGFWELILLQVKEVMAQFSALRKLEENSWSIPKSPMPVKKMLDGTPSTPSKKKPRDKTPAQKARDEQRRKMLAAKKLEMRARMQAAKCTDDGILA